MRLADRVAIVTGAAGGLGLAFSRRLIEEGASTVLADVRDPTPEIQALIAANPRAAFVKTDVSSEGDAKRLAQTALSEFGRIDVLINNAAMFATLAATPFDELTVADWKQLLAVNVIGTFACTQAVMPTMKTHKSGKVINVCSNAVHKGLPLYLHYVASKGAVLAMTRALARELGSYGITVNAVAPGLVIHEGTADAYAERNKQVVKLRSLARTQTPEDLVGTIIFLASDDSNFITGQTIVVDGGEVFA